MAKKPQKHKCLIVVGTRPEAIKMIPVIQALQKSDFCEPVVVGTGQHKAMVDDLFKHAGIEQATNLAAVGAGGADLNLLWTHVIDRFNDFAMAEFSGLPLDLSEGPRAVGDRPLFLMVHGDTSSSASAAVAAFHLRIPIVHVEAGLRTNLTSSPFPEEMNRQLIGCLACLHLAPTDQNAQNLIREQIDKQTIFVTGNTGIDALIWAGALELPFDQPEIAELYDGDSKIVLVTAHRRENWGGGLAAIGEGVRRLADSHPEVSFIAPLHPNPIVREELGTILEGCANVLTCEPLDYGQFARLLGRCYFVITDSGGIQEEAPALGKPVLVARDTTERTEGVYAGTLELVGTNPDLIEAAGARLLDDEAEYTKMSTAQNPYGDGHAAERIVAAAASIVADGPLAEPFGPGYSRAAVLAAAGMPVELRHHQAGYFTLDVDDSASTAR